MFIAGIIFVLANCLLVRLPFSLDPGPLYLVLPLALYGLVRHSTRVVSALGLSVLLTAWFIDSQMQFRVTETRASMVLEGNICSLPTVRDDVATFMFCRKDTGAKYRLSWFRPEAPLVPGQVWRLVVKLGEPTGSVNFDQFDYEQWQFAKRIHGRGYVRSSPEPVLIGEGSAGIDLARYRMRQLLNRVMPEDSVATLFALSLGDTSGLSRQQWELLNRTGTTHLLIVSGLHVGLISTLSVLFFRVVGVPLRLGSVLAVMTTASYALLAGFGLPVQRALIMTIVVIVALNLGRQIRPGVQFLVAMVAVIVFDPLATLSNGFWLSFGAVGALLFGMAGWQNRWTFGWVIETLRTQWIVFIMLMTPLACLMQQIPLGAMLVNVVGIPWVGMMLVPAMLLGIFLMGASEALSLQVLLFVSWQVSLLWQFLGWAGSLEFVYPAPQLSPGAVVMGLVGGILLLLPRGLVVRWPGLIMLALLFKPPEKLPAGSLRLTFLDVGQGLSAIAETRHGIVVYDTGPSFGDRYSAAAQVIVPALQQSARNRIDRLVISHTDNDHAGGRDILLRSLDVTKIVDHGACDDRWQLDGIQFVAFSPVDGEIKTNDSSCLLLIDTGYRKILLTGDIEEAGEYALVATAPGMVDVISSPHHGSISSSTPALLNALRPDTVVVSAGFENRFGHPDPKVVTRYRNRSIRVFNTADEGAVRIHLLRERMIADRARVAQPAIWRRDASRNKAREHR